MRLMLIEDNESDAFLVREALKGAPSAWQAEFYEDPRLALANIASGQTIPDLVILDLNLSRMDGVDVLKAIRKTKSLTELPVVILTSSLSPNDKAACLTNGASGYVVKPFDLDEFLVAVQQILTLRPLHADALVTQPQP